MIFFSRFFPISLWFNASIAQYWNHLLWSFSVGFISLFFIFLCNQENLHLIHHHLDLFYDIRNAIEEHNEIKITTFRWFFSTYLISRKKWFKKFFNNLNCFIINHHFYGINMNYDKFFIGVFRKDKANIYF